MFTEIGPMIVSTGELLFRPGIHAARVRHRTLPVVFGEGATDSGGCRGSGAEAHA